MRKRYTALEASWLKKRSPFSFLIFHFLFLIAKATFEYAKDLPVCFTAGIHMSKEERDVHAKVIVGTVSL